MSSGSISQRGGSPSQGSASGGGRPTSAVALARAVSRLGTKLESAAWTGARGVTGRGAVLSKHSPIDGERLLSLTLADAEQAGRVAVDSRQAFASWAALPAPARGQAVRLMGDAFRRHKADLAELITLEVGKTSQEALGEVQEMVDICDFAVGLSRQLHGITMPSERFRHRLSEQWHPLGPVLVITAFNFPMAVWAWNAALALVAGDSVVWKPSEKAPVCALAVHCLATAVLREAGAPEGTLGLVLGGADVGESLASSSCFPLVSATGSTRMGRQVGQVVAGRLGRSLLELGGNNAVIVAPSANLDLALRAVVFGAAGTTGQRCTTTRRLLVHESLAEDFLRRVARAFEGLPLGDPRDARVVLGPLIDEAAALGMKQALDAARAQGGAIIGGERVTEGAPAGGVYVRPALVRIAPEAPVVAEETFAPILYASTYRDFSEAIALQNGVSQGLSSAVFTDSVREAELFCSAFGSDCGIANVNVGTSGAEIGGAFGGDKDTGGGRESGSDAWKAYMRRVTHTVNFSAELPLAQGIRFDF